MNSDFSSTEKKFVNLLNIVRKLRGPEGCPWDREQTLYSMKDMLLEEAYETVEALDDRDMASIKEEFGDMLLHVLLHAVIAEEDGHFQIGDVIDHISEKLVRRHPHVFGNVEVSDTAQVMQNWEEIKRQEKGSIFAKDRLLDSVSKGLPPILESCNLQKKAASVGFDWDDVEMVLEKLDEEVAELKEAIQDKDFSDGVLHELGDLMFVVVNLARHSKISPDEAMRQANYRFRKRFNHIEGKLKDDGRTLDEATLDEMETLWQEAKKI